MNNFLKYTLATVLGILLYSLISMFILFGVMGAIAGASKNKEVEIKEKSFLYMKLDKPIVDRASDNPFENFNFQTFQPDPKIGLNDILENLEKAKNDEKIKGVYLELSFIPAGIATIEEVRDALLDFKESGKFIYTYAEVLTQGSYYLASVSDKIYLNPVGEMSLKGLRAQVTFFKGTLDKIGVEPIVFRHGKFKSAIEPFIRESMSEANKEQTKTYVQSIWDHIVANIAIERGLTVDKINELADNLTIRNAQSAVDNGIIDGLKYKDEILDELVELTEVKKPEKLRAVKLSKYKNVKLDDGKRRSRKTRKDKIAVVYASGQIVMGNGEGGSMGSEKISKAIRKARRDSTVKAIVLRVNSPGGSALASDVIWREAVLAKQEKPFIVSMGDVAASGGYYIACPADAIVASPVTITGSIGVFGLLFNTQELMNQKLGVTFDGVSTNKYSDLGNPNRKMTEAEKEVIQQGVEEVYATFISHVGQGRDMTTEAVDEIGQGRVWSGVNAKEIGLIDEFGGLNKAIAMAAEKAGVEDYKTVGYPIMPDPIEELIKSITEGVKVKILKNELGESYNTYKKIENIKHLQGVQARMPFDVELY